jgi:hypothetical protein
MSTPHGRAVSDVVSFTLVFSTIIFMIGVVTVTGIGTLGDVQAGTESNVAEETMRNYAASLADHRTQSAERRSTTIKLQGHSLDRVSSTLNVTIGARERSITTGALVRTTNTDTELVYETGGVFRSEENGIVVVRQPPIRCTARVVHLPLTLVRGDINIASDNRVTLESERVTQRIDTVAAGGSTDVTVNVSGTARPDGWAKVFTGSSWSGSGDEYTCPGVERVVIHETVVSIDDVR